MFRKDLFVFVQEFLLLEESVASDCSSLAIVANYQNFPTRFASALAVARRNTYPLQRLSDRVRSQLKHLRGRILFVISCTNSSISFVDLLLADWNQTVCEIIEFAEIQRAYEYAVTAE